MSDTCGSYAGYQRHKRHGQQPCAACREANRLYHLNYRQQPEVRQRYSQQNAARGRALEALRRRHPGEFEVLLDKERGKQT